MKVISGGQTGCDQAALRAAKAAGLATGGWAPKGWLTEDGPAPWLAEYGLEQCFSADYRVRTGFNVDEADAVLWLGNPYSPGGRLTLRLAQDMDVPVFVVLLAGATAVSTPKEVADWIFGRPTKDPTQELVLMVAGNRESGAPGFGARAEAFLAEVFALLAVRMSL